jgi:hypothetical protein
MKYAVKTLLIVLGTVALCACESLPTGDSFDRDGVVPSRNQALSKAYSGFRSEVGVGGSSVDRMNAFYTPNW